MQTIRQLGSLRDSLAALRKAGQTIGLVPTMGALHPGHIALVEAAKADGHAAIASIFVNPTQFGANEDLDAYPRQEEEDSAMLRDAGTDILWMPGVDQIYPAGFSTNVTVGGLGKNFCGAARPGHFDGVATVVAKLLNQTRPDAAYFGQKDFQQLAIIRRMARDLDFVTDIVGVPTVRDPDGLAMSSRNSYMSAEERKAAIALPRTMEWAVQRLEAGEDVATILADARARLNAAGFHKIDYFELCDPDNLEIVHDLSAPARLLAAARMGPTRLIDNLSVTPR